MRSTPSGLALLVLTLLSGCGVTVDEGQASSSGATSSSTRGGGSGTTSAGACGTAPVGASTSGGGGLDAGPGERDAGPAYATCPGSCGTPAGTVQPLPTAEALYAALQGRWRLCGDRSFFASAPADAIGVEYGPASSAPTPGGGTAGGAMYYLVQGPAGPVRGVGFAYQLTYDLAPEGPGVYQLNMHPAPNSGFAGYPRYSPCPEQFELNGYSVALLSRL